MYIERFCEHFTGDIFYFSLEAVLLENGFQGELYKKSDLQELIEELESADNEWRKLRFEDYVEMQEEVQEKISSNINNDAYLKKYICGIMRPFKEMSDLIYPSPESETEKLAAGRFLKDLHLYRLPRESELNELARVVGVKLRAQESFNSLPEEEKIKRFNEALKTKVSEYEKIVDSNRYHVATLVMGMMEELAVFISACLLEAGSSKTAFDFQRMCGVVLTDEIEPFYFERTMDWTRELSKSYLPVPIYYYSDTPESILKRSLYTDNRYRINGATLCDIDEIDCLFKQIKRDEPNYSAVVFNASVDSFRSKCDEMAESDNTKEVKTAWIINILNSMSEVYYAFAHTEHVLLAQCARHFMVIVEAAFMRAPEQICVRHLFNELGIDNILDVEDERVSEDVAASRSSANLHPITWEESLIREEIGPSLKYQEKRLCEKCQDTKCHYRSGQRDFFWQMDEAGITPDEYADIPNSAREKYENMPAPIEEDFDDENIEEPLKVEEMSAIQKFGYFYGGKYAIDLIVKILATNHHTKSIIKIYNTSPQKVAKQIVIDDAYYKHFELSYWDDLCAEIRNEIASRRGDGISMRQYMYSLLKPFSLHSRYLFPVETEDKNSIDGAKFLRQYAFKDKEGYSSYIEEKASIIKQIETGKYASGVPTQHLLNLSKWENSYRTQSLMREYLGYSYDWLLLKLYIDVKKYAAVIAGQLLEIENEKLLEDYQKEFGIKLCDDLDLVDIALGNSRSIEYFASLLNSRRSVKPVKVGNYASGDTIIQENPSRDNIQYLQNRVESKSYVTKERLINTRVNALCNELVRKKYAKLDDIGILTWIKDKDAYAYLCYKLTDVFVGSQTEIEMKFISQNIITCTGNLETLANYANKYRKGKKSKPEYASVIDSLIDSAHKGMLG